jgi:hypothetical protein
MERNSTQQQEDSSHQQIGLKSWGRRATFVVQLCRMPKLGHFGIYIKSFETWSWRRLEISWTHRVRNQAVLQSQGGEEHPTYHKTKDG